MTSKLSPLARFFSKRSRNPAGVIPTHLMADCGFEAEGNSRQINSEIDRLTLMLNALR